jgi:hypothetical protein
MRQPTLARDFIELGFLTVGGLIGLVCGFGWFVGMLILIGLLGPHSIFTVPVWPYLVCIVLMLAGMSLGIFVARAFRGPY